MLEADGEPLGILLLFGLLYQFEVFHNKKKKKLRLKKKKLHPKATVGCGYDFQTKVLWGRF